MEAMVRRKRRRILKEWLPYKFASSVRMEWEGDWWGLGNGGGGFRGYRVEGPTWLYRRQSISIADYFPTNISSLQFKSQFRLTCNRSGSVISKIR